jgi:hypothetical protein
MAQTTQEQSSPAKLTPAEVTRMFGEDYREIEILADGTLRERSPNGGDPDEQVTRTLKTGRTWY